MTLPLILRRAALTPRSLDREARTVEATASTGAPVQRQDGRGAFTERLDLSAIDPVALAGITILDAHSQGSTRDAIGVIEEARMENGSLVVTIKIARGIEGDGVLDKIEDGVLRGVSIGYRAAKVKETKGAQGERVRTITPEIVEVSIVPVPADPGALMRSTPLPNEQIETVESLAPETANRSQTNREIRSIASLAGLSREWADTQIDTGAEIDAVRTAAFDAMRTRTPATVRTSATADHNASENFIEHRAEALFARANPSCKPSEPSRRYAGDSMVDIARDCLTRGGQSITGLAAGELATRALQTTSDFPLILGNAVGRTLRDAYNATPSGLKMAARQTTARDFRSKHRVQLGEAPTLEKVGESGEFKRGTLAEAEETYRLDTFGRIIGISRQAIINDDLGAFSNLSGRIGVAAASFEATQLVTLLETNGVMSDGTALFHSKHGNLAVSSGALTEDSLSVARLAMRKQTGLSGDMIDVTPRNLIVPPDLETLAEKLLSAVQANKTEDVNPFASLSLIVEPRLTSATRWFVSADPATVDGLEYAYLEGAPGPQTETRQGFDVDGVEVKVRLDFGAGFVDWRGWHMNEGA